MKKWRSRTLIAEKMRIVSEFGYSLDSADDWYRRFLKHQNHALDRGIKSLLTFRQYMGKVREAALSKPEQIGPRRDQYNLGRIGDIGDYVVGNCRFITSQQNRREARENGRCIESSRANGERAKGLTKDTSERYRKVSVALRGRKAADYPYIAENAIRSAKALKGRTKENDPRMVVIAEKLARSFVIVGPDGATHEGKNLKEHCTKFGLNFGHMAAVLRGVERHHKGWTGRYADAANLATLETLPPMPKQLEWEAI